MSDIGWNGRWDSQHGMTLRDYFAGQALVGLLAGRAPRSEFTSKEIATSAYCIAEAMIKERDA
jgi:hypothetical protein